MPLTCTSCHGDAARVGSELLKSAPPAGAGGETATTARAVGAHQVHLTGSRWSNGFACTECHVVPTSMNHPDGPVNLAWGTIATKGGTTTPAWNGATCTNHCHGTTILTAGTNEAPSWTGGAAQADCWTCHGRPTTGVHGVSGHRRMECGACHGAGYTPTTVNKDLHVDGTLQVPDCDTCHGGE